MAHEQRRNATLANRPHDGVAQGLFAAAGYERYLMSLLTPPYSAAVLGHWPAQQRAAVMTANCTGPARAAPAPAPRSNPLVATITSRPVPTVPAAAAAKPAATMAATVQRPPTAPSNFQPPPAPAPRNAPATAPPREYQPTPTFGVRTQSNGSVAAVRYRVHFISP